MKKSKSLVYGAVIAALYVILTLISSLFGISSGIIQLRLSEALCVLPCFTPVAIPGLAVGCALANLLTGANAIDIIVGALATLIGALLTRALRKNRFLAVLPPILANAIIIPFVLTLAYGLTEYSYLYLLATVGLGEIISAGLLGQLVYQLVKKNQNALFG